jgi:hypothetical protein
VSGLASFALGISAARAIKNQTWAADRVLYEPTAPVDPSDFSAGPMICVYSARGRSALGDDDLIDASDVRLRFEIFLPPIVNAGGVSFSTQASQGLVFAIIWRQIEEALLVQESIWAHCYRLFRFEQRSLDVERDLYEPAKGIKIPVACFEIKLTTVAEPTIGIAAQPVWQEFLAAMQSDTAELASLAPLMAAQILGDGGALPDWQVAMGMLGITKDEASAIGLGPLVVTTVVTDLDNGAAVLETVVNTIDPLPSLGGE